MALPGEHLPREHTGGKEPIVINQRVRLGVSAGIVGSLIIVAGACGGSTTETGGAASTTVPVTAKSSTDTTENIGGGTSGTDKPTITIKQGETTTTVKSTATTTKKVLGPEFVTAAGAAFQAELGDYKALEITIHPDQPRAVAQAQDPAKPANIDAYEFTGGNVSSPSPVTLTGDAADLEANLFLASSIAWDQIPAMMEQAVVEIGELEGSTGVTHLIIQKNLPFDEDTVINIYVDGGTRSQGGYVSFLNDGTLKKVYGP